MPRSHTRTQRRSDYVEGFTLELDELLPQDNVLPLQEPPTSPPPPPPQPLPLLSRRRHARVHKREPCLGFEKRGHKQCVYAAAAAAVVGVVAAVAAAAVRVARSVSLLFVVFGTEEALAIERQRLLYERTDLAAKFFSGRLQCPFPRQR